mgnify:CR=1 FL=1
MIKIKLDVRQAAAVRDALFRETRQDSYEFPSQRTLDIREAITSLDAELEKHTL